MARRLLIAIAVLIPCAFAPIAAAQICAPFTDVAAASGFCTNIQWMHNRGITLGCTATAYCPTQFVRRDQMAAFMNRLGNVVFEQGGSAFGATAVLGTKDDQPLDFVVNGTRAMRYELDDPTHPNASPHVIGGHAANFVAPGNIASTIGGGGTAGSPNRASASFGVVGGGAGNEAGAGATVGGGTLNAATGQLGTIAGGTNNDATGNWSFVGGGNGNKANGSSSTVAGGSGNIAGGDYSTVPGGNDNSAPGYYSFAAGYGARANYAGCFVYADASSFNPTSCFGQGEIVIRGLGGFYFWTTGNSDVTYFGARLAPGTGAWAAYSDRNGKERIDPVDTRAVLEKLAAMPIATWQWKGEPGSVRHMGPMAQDFHRAFGLGDRETEIVTIDADGVALAAIQGLNAKVERQGAEIAALKAELAALRRRIEAPAVVAERGQ